MKSNLLRIFFILCAAALLTATSARAWGGRGGSFSRSGSYRTLHHGSGTISQSVNRSPGSANRSSSWTNANGTGSRTASNTYNNSTGTGTHAASTTYANGLVKVVAAFKPPLALPGRPARRAA